MALVRISEECGKGLGALPLVDAVLASEQQCETWCSKLSSKGLLEVLPGIVICDGPKPDGGCGARIVEAPLVETHDLSITSSTK